MGGGGSRNAVRTQREGSKNPEEAWGGGSVMTTSRKRPNSTAFFLLCFPLASPTPPPSSLVFHLQPAIRIFFVGPEEKRDENGEKTNREGGNFVIE